MLVGITVLGVGLALLPLVPSPLWVIVIMGIFGGAPAGAIVSLPAEILKPENRGPGLGLFITWYYGAMAVLPPIAGWLQDISGDAGAPLYFGGFVMVAGLPFLGLLRGLQRRLSLKRYKAFRVWLPARPPPHKANAPPEGVLIDSLDSPDLLMII